MKLNEISPLVQGIVGIALATFLLSSPDSGLAQSSYMQSKSSNLYRAHETSMDIFAGYVNAQRGITHLFQTGLRHGSMGGGFGVNYFSSEHLGFGTDLVIPNNGGSFVDSYTMNVIYRMPLGSSGLAPYVSGGGGRSYDPFTQWIGQAAIGLEYRSESKAGLFVDGRYVWGEKHSQDSLLLRAGLRFIF
jgi:hypothetical protein